MKRLIWTVGITGAVLTAHAIILGKAVSAARLQALTDARDAVAEPMRGLRDLTLWCQENEQTVMAHTLSGSLASSLDAFEAVNNLIDDFWEEAA